MVVKLYLLGSEVVKFYLLGTKVVVAMNRMAGWDGSRGGEA